MIDRVKGFTNGIETANSMDMLSSLYKEMTTSGGRPGYYAYKDIWKNAAKIRFQEIEVVLKADLSLLADSTSTAATASDNDTKECQERILAEIAVSMEQIRSFLSHHTVPLAAKDPTEVFNSIFVDSTAISSEISRQDIYAKSSVILAYLAEMEGSLFCATGANNRATGYPSIDLLTMIAHDLKEVMLMISDQEKEAFFAEQWLYLLLSTYNEVCLEVGEILENLHNRQVHTRAKSSAPTAISEEDSDSLFLQEAVAYYEKMMYLASQVASDDTSSQLHNILTRDHLEAVVQQMNTGMLRLLEIQPQSLF